MASPQPPPAAASSLFPAIESTSPRHRKLKASPRQTDLGDASPRIAGNPELQREAPPAHHPLQQTDALYRGGAVLAAAERAPSSVAASLPFLPSGSPRIIYSGSATNDEWQLKQSKARDAEAIANAKAAVGDTRKPVRTYPHLRNNAKRRLADAQERARIEKENQRLRDNLARRARVRPPGSMFSDDGKNSRHVAYQLAVRSNLRRIEQKRVEAENEALSARIRNAQQASRNEQEAIEEDWQQRLVLLRRVARHPLVIVEEAEQAQLQAATVGAEGSTVTRAGQHKQAPHEGGSLMDRVAWDTDVHVPLPKGRGRPLY
jgi:hypothetical protein